MVVFRLDGCGITCLVLTYASLCYADYVVVKVLIIPVLDGSLGGSFLVVGFNILVTLMMVSHLRAVFSDPGIVPVSHTPVDLSDQDLNNAKGPNGWSLCTKCETYRPPRAHHCRVCQRCIRRMDHHCPWINNCVGEWNQKYFVQFLVYVGLISCSCIVIIVASWILDPVSAHVRSQEAKVLHSIILAVISVLYGLFVLAIMSDQFGAICSDESPIDSLKSKEQNKRTTSTVTSSSSSSTSRDFESNSKPREGQLYNSNNHHPKSTMSLMRNVFGRGPVIFWLCPCDVGAKRTLSTNESYSV